MIKISKLDKLFFEPTNRSIYLAIFRVFIAFHILKKLYFSWPNAQLLYSSDSFVSHYSGAHYLGFLSIDWIRDNLLEFYIVFAVLCVFMAFGIGRHITVLLVALGTDIHQALNSYLLDGGDNLLKFVVFYLAIANCYSFLTLKRWQPSSEIGKMLDNFFTRVAVFCLIAHLCLVYTVAGFSKAHADVWYNGVAVYYIYMNERFMGTPWNQMLGKNFWFTTISSYATIIWESCFAFGVFVKPLRVPWLLLGVSMHLGIYVFMMIHEFQWLFIVYYGFFFTDEELRSIARAFSLSSIRRSFLQSWVKKPFALTDV
ncbi:MAG: hypothetical protein P8R31_00120 [Mariniblastus sp.]|nr:hypothetical protein [Mariniblastus sp.]